MKKHTLLSLLALVAVYSATAQQTSPYVEPGTLIVNNSGFKAASIRTVPLSRPTPMHVQDDPVNQTISPRFVVAKADVLLGGLLWAEANGFTAAANSSLLGGIIALVPTGCNAYLELSAPLAQWRLPTQREMMLISLVRFELANQGLGFSVMSGVYWCATQLSATLAWVYAVTTGVLSPLTKTTIQQVRCIRDL